MSRWVALMAGFGIQLKLAALTPLALVASAVSPLAYGLVVVAGYGRPDAALLLGTVAAGLWATLLTQGAIIITQERNWRTLSALAMSPTPLGVPLTGRLLAAAAQGLVAAPLLVGVLVALFGTTGPVPVGRSVLALLVLAVGLVGMALALVGLLARYRYSAGMVNGLIGVVYLLGGLFVPVSALPGPAAAVGRLLPTGAAVAAVRPDMPHPWTDVGVAALVAGCWLLAGIGYLSRAPARMRVSPAPYQQ